MQCPAGGSVLKWIVHSRQIWLVQIPMRQKNIMDDGKNNNNNAVHLHLAVLPLDFHCGISNLVLSMHVAVQQSPQIVSVINITRCHRFFCWSPIWRISAHKADALPSELFQRHLCICWVAKANCFESWVQDRCQRQGGYFFKSSEFFIQIIHSVFCKNGTVSTRDGHTDWQ